MKRYKASEIINRAYDLADVKNTDFLTHEENIHYINDAWKQVYQWLINKGDKQFVKEVRLGGAAYNGFIEYEIPDDLYQILSIKSSSGYIVPRKVESESISSGTYEVVNDKIRLYGTTSDLILTYWMTPVWITYPDRDVAVDTLSPSDTIIDSCGNSVLVQNGSTYTILNLLTGETIADVSWIKDVTHDGGIYLGNGHIVCGRIDNSNTMYYDFEGNELGYGSLGLITHYMNNVLTDGNFIGTSVVVNPTNRRFIGGNECNKFFTSVSSTDGYVRLYRVRQDDDEIEVGSWKSTIQFNKFIDIDGNRCYFVTTNRGLLYFDGKDLLETEKPYVGVVAYLKYGPLTYNGYWTIKSIEEDTIFNFPNELYTSLLSADLAVRYAMKMNANIEGLNQLYQTMQTTFMNTLDQDANYTRINNIYRA